MTRVGAKLSRVGPIWPRADNWVERRLYFAEKKDRMAFSGWRIFV
jgi:hypothetical protein